MITIYTKPYSITEYYSGVYRYDASENENEVNIQNLDFTVVYNIDRDMDIATVEEIVWADGEPRNVEEVNEKIKEQFFDKLA